MNHHDPYDPIALTRDGFFVNYIIDKLLEQDQKNTGMSLKKIMLSRLNLHKLTLSIF